MIVRAIIGVLGLGALAALCWFAARGDAGGFGVPRAYRAADVPLPGTGGRAVSLRRGPRLVVFGYVGCADRCPLTLRLLSDAVRSLGTANAARVTFVDVDPWHDSPPVVARYVAHFAGVDGVTGDMRALAANEAALGMRPVTDARGVEEHDTRVFVLDRAGVVVGALSPQLAPEDVASRIRTMLAAGAP